MQGSNYGEFWEFSKHEFAVYVTNLAVEGQKAWQLMQLYRDRARETSLTN